ncbi:MAG: sigma-70 family RNA polymerase sigma factor [Bacteroidota bacterium]
MNTLIESKYVKGITENDVTILQEIYQQFLPEVVKYVRNNSGSLDDAKDIFQEAILVIYDKAKKDELTLTSTFAAYLFSICKNMWLKKLRSKNSKVLPLSATWGLTIENEYEERFLKTRKWRLFNRKFQDLAEECRKVLQMLFNGQSGKEIAAEMGYTEDYAKRKKYKCKLSFMELIRKDPEFKALVS